MNMNSIYRSNRMGISLIFLIHGLINGIWYANLPYIKQKLMLSNTELSWALLAATSGAIPGLMFAGWLVKRFGSRKVVIGSSLIYLILLPLLYSVPSYTLLCFLLVFNGAALGIMDVSMNARAVETEEGYGKAIMSSVHAFFSIAGFFAALAVKAGYLIELTVPHLVYIYSGLVGILFIVALKLLKSMPSVIRDNQDQESSKVLIFPKGALIGIAVLIFLGFLSEGGIYDWATIFLNKERGLEKGTAALGYGLFSVLMALGRITGDYFTRKLGQVRFLRLSSLWSTLFMLIALLTKNPYGSLVSLGLVGLGMANVVPILFSAAGRSGIMPPGSAIAAVSMVGYFGFIIGPPLIGMLADGFSLNIAMSILGILTFTVALFSQWARVGEKDRSSTIRIQ